MSVDDATRLWPVRSNAVGWNRSNRVGTRAAVHCSGLLSDASSYPSQPVGDNRKPHQEKEKESAL